MMLIGASPSSEQLQSSLLRMGLPLYEGYGMSETNMISCNTRAHSVLGTVGPLWPGIEAKIADDGCALVRTEPVRSGCYLNASAEENADTFLEDGWVHTGDLAELRDGCLRIVGRAKDVIVSSGGKNINPVAVEKHLQSLPSITQAVVYGDNRPYLVAVLSGDQPLDAAAVQAIQRQLNRINEAQTVYLRVLAFVVADPVFSEAGGSLTRSGKPRRQNILNEYRDRLDALYANGE